MTKLLLILLVGLGLESAGVILLKKGMSASARFQPAIPPDPARRQDGRRLASILLGVFFEALFFGALLISCPRATSVSCGR